MIRLLTLVTWTAGLGAVIVLAVGPSEALGWRPITDIAGPAGGDPLVLATDVARIVVAALAARLAVLTVAALVAEALGSARVAARLVAPLPRAIGSQIRRAGVVAAVGAVVLVPAGGSAGATDPGEPPVAVMTHMGPATSSTSPTTGHPPASMTHLGDEPVLGARHEVLDAPPHRPRGWLHAPVAVHVVEAGDHFWSIARDVVTGHLGHPPTDREIAAYWLRLVAANLDRLVDPTEPDLIHPGLVVTLPPL